ncbi:MAG: ribosome biogenesis GTPase Der [Bacteroidia bacterium]|nr:ribosome biogenesis GTPase Der [Bacteroidia bacterium]MCO5254128.1 ribosome biogenesis GTPase Der [Bacteroidota bacterium]
MGNIVAIVGRPNVGKSTLFNRLTGERKAIVHDSSGVTRDRHYGECEWTGRSFTVIDTGGYVPNSSDVFEKAIVEQVNIAIQESDLLLFVVDVTNDITDLDMAFANVLRKTGKPVIIVANKTDNQMLIPQASVFYSFGFDELYTISSLSGTGTGELLDRVVALLPKEPEADIQEVIIPKVAILGRPNVGKSSLTNTLLGNDRNIVTDVAGTTRDSIHSHYNAFGKEMILIDTAGIRRKKNVIEDIEFYSVMRSLRSMEEADICVIMIDATIGMDAQDVNLFYLAHRRGKGIVVLVNKWDIVEKDTHTAKDYTQVIHSRVQPFSDFPILFISAINKQRIYDTVQKIQMVYENRHKHISTSKLNEFVQEIMERHPPQSKKGKHVKIKYATQLKTNYPCFVFFCNLPQYLTDAYKRYIENQMRKEFDFNGVPVKMFFRKK